MKGGEGFVKNCYENSLPFITSGVLNSRRHSLRRIEMLPGLAALWQIWSTLFSEASVPESSLMSWNRIPRPPWCLAPISSYYLRVTEPVKPQTQLFLCTWRTWVTPNFSECTRQIGDLWGGARPPRGQVASAPTSLDLVFTLLLPPAQGQRVGKSH